MDRLAFVVQMFVIGSGYRERIYDTLHCFSRLVAFCASLDGFPKC